VLDEIDLQIIRCLRENSRMQWKQIGEIVHMSGVAVAKRIQRLEELGVIERYTVEVNERKLGNRFCAFITVVMKDWQHTKFQQFIRTREEIREAHRISGEPCFILKVEVPDQDSLSELLDRILDYGHYKINVSIGRYK